MRRRARGFSLFRDMLGALILFADLIVVPEVLFGVAVTVASVLAIELGAPTMASNMSWSIIGLMVIFPLTSSITNAFRRREEALAAVARFRSHLTHLTDLHATLEWPGASAWGGSEDGEGEAAATSRRAARERHLQRVRGLLSTIVDALHELLSLPRCERMRDFVARPEANWDLHFRCRARCVALTRRLQRGIEALKAAGLPSPEASHLHAVGEGLLVEIENLWMLKTYRTSNMLRALMRVSAQLTPITFGPYFVYMKESLGGGARGLGFSLAFACLVSVLLTALTMLESRLENPFREDRDTVRLSEEMRLCREAITAPTADASDWWRIDDDQDGDHPRRHVLARA